MSNAPADRARPGLAALWMSGAILSFSLMAVAGRAVSTNLDTFEIMMFRSFIGLAIISVLAVATGTWREITTRHMGLQVTRNIFHFTGQNLWFWAITIVPLAQVFALEFTSPVWVTLLAPLVLGEKLTNIRVLSAILGFLGVLIIVRPGAESLSPGILAAGASALCFAATAMLTKMLTRTETITCILFWLTAIQAVLGIAASGWDGDVALPTLANLPWIVLIGCAGLLAHFCLTSALKVAPAAIVMPMDFVRLPAIAVVGWLVYGEALDPLVALGALVIFGANYLNIWTESRKSTDK